jgi:hypothetical protein
MPGERAEQSEEAVRAAELRERRAKDAARLAHKQAADANEQRAEDLSGHGDPAGARKAHERADAEREREDHT